jgi:starch phosphorylase
MPNYKNKTIAYLSLEIALENKLPTYAGGLGVLAGDILRSAADVNFPMVGITLINRRGYLQQEITSGGEQIAHSEKKYDFSKLEKISKTITLQMGAEKVFIRAWRYWLNGASGKIPIYLLDSDLSQNSKESRLLTDRLYDANKTTRLRQEIILGRGGVKMLRALGYKIYKYHLNEGHGSLATVELLISSLDKQEEKKLASVRQQCVFTTHTPLPGAQDVFQKDFFILHQADWPKQLNCLFEKDKLNMTKLGLYCCGRVNAVSKLHQAVSEQMFPNYPIDYVTNGVNSLFWTSPELAAIYNRLIPGWAKDPSLLVRVKDIDQTEIAGAHLVAKRRLLKYIQKKTGEKLEEQALTIVFARRFTPYKRPGLIFQDIKKLKEIAKRHGGLQLIFSGKAHPSDLAGQKLIKMVHNYSAKLKGSSEDYFFA